MKKLLPLVMSSVAMLTLGASSLSSTALAAPSNDKQVVNKEAPRGGKYRMDLTKMKEMREKRQAALHDKLNLTSKQEAAWKQYVATTDKMGPPPMMKEGKDSKDKLTAVDRAQNRLDYMKTHIKDMESHVAAMKNFYATLTPEQQQIFDSEMRFRPRHGLHNGGYGPQANCDVPTTK